MKTFLARTALAFALFSAAVAAAKPYESSDLITANFNAQGSTRYQSAHVELNHATDALKLVLQPPMPPCHSDFCIQRMPVPAIYNFEAVSSSIDRCNVVTTKAIIDGMPVDGVTIEVTLLDNSNYSCHARRPAASLTVDQKWYDRVKGRQMHFNDLFLASKVQVSVPFQGVIEAELDANRSERFDSAHLSLDAGKGHVNLSLQPVMPACVQDACIQMMPQPIVYDLENAVTTETDCGTIQTIASFDETPVDGIKLEVIINNNSNFHCQSFGFAPVKKLEVIVNRTTMSRRGIVETTDVFNADDFAVIKPGK